MSQEHRYLRGDVKEITLPVHGNTVIEKGDFIIVNTQAGTVTHSAAGRFNTADYYAFPVSMACDVTHIYFTDQFAGIAMKGSASGVTENIPVATDGFWRYPLTVTNGTTVGLAVSLATTAANVLADQEVLCASLPAGGVSTLAVGICARTQAASTSADFRLITRYSGVSGCDIFKA